MAYQVSPLDKNLGGVRIASDQVIAVIDLDHIAIWGVELLNHHHTARSRQDRGSRLSRVVQASVQG